MNTYFRLSRLACVLLSIVMIVGTTAGQATVSSQKPVQSQLVRSSQGGRTHVPLSEDLKALLARGAAPKDLPQLRELELQQRKVVARINQVTVNLQLRSKPSRQRAGVPTQGSGVIITGDGYILTAAHVIEAPGLKVKVVLHDGRVVRAKTLGMNRHVDAGLLKMDEPKLDGQPWPHASLGKSSSLKQGMWCIATGHPEGYDPVRGPVVRVGRILAVRKNALVTDCALIGGDSGGPLFDISGRLIAVHSRIGDDVTDNLHVPVYHYGTAWDDLVAGKAWGYLPGFRPILGVRGEKNSESARIKSVYRGSPAAKAGIRAGDVIVKFGDKAIDSFQALTQAVAETMPGKRVSVMIYRDENTQELTVEIGRDPRS